LRTGTPRAGDGAAGRAAIRLGGFVVCAAFLASAACAPSSSTTYYRYYTSSRTGSAERAELQRRAKERGLIRSAGSDWYAAPAGRAAPLHIRARPWGTPSGSVVELQSARIDLINRLSRVGRTYSAMAVSTLPITGEASIELGLSHKPYLSAASWRLDAAWGFTVPLLTGDGGGWEPELRSKLSLRTMVGLAIDERLISLRPELAMELELQKTASPLPGTTFGTTEPVTVELGLAALVGDDEIRGGEVSVGLHFKSYGGVFVRAGYEDTALGRGPTWMAGLRLGTRPTIYVVAMTAFVWAMYALATADWDRCHEGGPHC
jgi:hypothetical protein